jgi:LPS export ABC transporter protein LptC
MKKLSLILPLSLTLASCAKPEPARDETRPLQRAYGVVISQSRKGAQQWLLKAKEAHFYDDKKIADITAPVLSFTDKTDGSAASASAKTAYYDEQNGLIAMRGDVEADSPAQRARLFTQEAFYDLGKKEIYANVPVKIYRGGIELEGQGLKASSDLANIEIFKQKTKLPKQMEELKKAAI